MVILKPTRAGVSIPRLCESYPLCSQAIIALAMHIRMVFAHVHAASDVHMLVTLTKLNLLN